MFNSNFEYIRKLVSKLYLFIYLFIYVSDFCDDVVDVKKLLHRDIYYPDLLLEKPAVQCPLFFLFTFLQIVRGVGLSNHC